MLKNTLHHSAWLLLSALIFLISCKEDPEVEVDTKKTILELSKSAFHFDAAGGVAELGIVSDVTWLLSDSVEWLSLSRVAGEGNSTITITADPNETTEIRETTIYISQKDTVGLVSISQEGAELILEWNVPPIVFDVSPDQSGMRDLTSIQLAAEMGIGWNVGNSLEAIGGETAWGNPLISKRLIDSVKAAGFNTIRIPVAWSKFSDASTYTIKNDWMLRVEEVVNYVLDNDMYALINIHWDGGWMNHPTYKKQHEINTRLYTMWTQIATHFRDYDDHLLFAGTNEVGMEGQYGTPIPQYTKVQNSFNQTFVNAARSTGGRNVYRHLIVQGYFTNIDHTVNYAVMPKDTVDSRLFLEVHYYDPYDFALNEGGGIQRFIEQVPRILLGPAQPAEFGQPAGQDLVCRQQELDVLRGVFQELRRQGTAGPVGARVGFGQLDLEELVHQGGVAELRRIAEQSRGDLRVEHLSRHPARQEIPDLDVLAAGMEDPGAAAQRFPQRGQIVGAEGVDAEQPLRRRHLHEAKAGKERRFTHELGIDADTVRTVQCIDQRGDSGSGYQVELWSCHFEGVEGMAAGVEITIVRS